MPCHLSCSKKGALLFFQTLSCRRSPLLSRLALASVKISMNCRLSCSKKGVPCLPLPIVLTPWSQSATAQTSLSLSWWPSRVALLCLHGGSRRDARREPLRRTRHGSQICGLHRLGLQPGSFRDPSGCKVSLLPCRPDHLRRLRHHEICRSGRRRLTRSCEDREKSRGAASPCRFLSRLLQPTGRNTLERPQV